MSTVFIHRQCQNTIAIEVPLSRREYVDVGRAASLKGVTSAELLRQAGVQAARTWLESLRDNDPDEEDDDDEDDPFEGLDDEDDDEDDDDE